MHPTKQPGCREKAVPLSETQYRQRTEHKERQHPGAKIGEHQAGRGSVLNMESRRLAHETGTALRFRAAAAALSSSPIAADPLNRIAHRFSESTFDVFIPRASEDSRYRRCQIRTSQSLSSS